MDVDAHAHAELLELVDEGDVDAAVDVLKELGHFGDGGAADGDHAAKDGSVHGGGQLDSNGAAAADDLGDVVAGNGVVAGIFALRRERHMEAGGAALAGDVQPARLPSSRRGTTTSSVVPG